MSILFRYGLLLTGKGSSGDPFPSGTRISYTVQLDNALPTGVYYWRFKAVDPNGENIWGDWSEIRSFTIFETHEKSASMDAILIG